MNDETVELKPFERLSRVIKNTEIRDVFLKKKHIDCFVHFSLVKPSSTTLEEVQNHSWSISNNKKALFCLINYKVDGYKTEETKSGEQKEKLFELECTLCVEYELSESSQLDSEDFEIFTQTNAYYNAYPYIRQFIQSESVTLRISPIVLPFLKPLSKSAINSLFDTGTK